MNLFETRYSHNGTATTERFVIMDSVCSFPVCDSEQNGKLLAALYASLFISLSPLSLAVQQRVLKTIGGMCLFVGLLSGWCYPYTVALTENSCKITAHLSFLSLCDYHQFWDAHGSCSLRRGPILYT